MSEDSQKGPQASSGIGYVLVVLVVLFTAAGYGLDHWLHTRPWFMVAGVFVGFGLGFTYAVLILKADTRGPRTREKKRSEEKQPDKDSSR